MENVVRRKQGGKKPPDKPKQKKDMIDRRALRDVPLHGPDYQIQPELLLEDFVEKEVKFAGVISRIPKHLDMTNRTDILRIIDRGKGNGIIPWYTTDDHDAIFRICVHDVKISRRFGAEEVLLRVPIYEIAATCYIQDDTSHILSLKYGDPNDEMCHLAVMYTHERIVCDQVCALLNQCFHLVYMDLTLQFVDNEFAPLDNGASADSTNSDGSYYKPRTVEPSFITGSHPEINRGAASASSHRKYSGSRSETRSESELSESAAETLKEYIKNLQTKLNPDELRQFAHLVRTRKEGSLPFSEFCRKVLELYGPNRKHLMPGMRPFIPEAEDESFDEFLRGVGVSTGNGNNGRGTHSTTYIRHNRRSPSDTSMFSLGGRDGLALDEFDIMLDDISAGIESMSTSVDMNTNPESYMPS